MQGLLAPSLLIALVHRGVDVPADKVSESAIPTLSGLTDLFVPTLYAQSPRPPAGPVKTITPRHFEGTATDGALMLLGRSQPASSFAYVAGKTDDSQRAASVAQSLRLAMQQVGIRTTVDVVQAAGAAEYYVTIGGFQSEESAAGLKKQIVEKILAGSRVDQATLKVLVNGPIVSGRVLAPR